MVRDSDMMTARADMYSSGMPLTRPNELDSTTHDTDGQGMVAPMPQSHQHHNHNRSQSFEMTMPTNMQTWPEHPTHDMFAYTESHMPTPASMTNSFPSPSSSESASTNSFPSPSSSRATSVNGGESCDCFAACLQSLQGLPINPLSPVQPPFDVFLSLNRMGVEACATILGCARCMSRSGTYTVVMLVMTVMGTVTECYKSATQAYFNGSAPSSMAAMMSTNCNGNGSHAAAGRNANSPTAAQHNLVGNGIGSLGGCLGLSLGAYQINAEDGRWLELEILARELSKMEEVYSRFQDICGDLSNDPVFSRVMISRLGQMLGSTLEVVIYHRKDTMKFVV